MESCYEIAFCRMPDIPTYRKNAFILRVAFLWTPSRCLSSSTLRLAFTTFCFHSCVRERASTSASPKVQETRLQKPPPHWQCWIQLVHPQMPMAFWPCQPCQHGPSGSARISGSPRGYGSKQCLWRQRALLPAKPPKHTVAGLHS